jgi:diaminopimelate epimerase
MNGLAFTKMHGLGNDFVVLDARARRIALGDAAARAIADRRIGVGCDQLLVIEPPTNGRADAFMRIHNADGGEVAACGNGTRCVASLLLGETGRERVVVETSAGLLQAWGEADGAITVDMGEPRLDWRDIPLAAPADTLHLDVSAGSLRDPVGVGMGNPHAVFFVDDAEAVALDILGPELEHHPMFPERVNVSVAQVLPQAAGRDRIRLRVWERGVGLTRACGTAACAALVAAHRRGLTGRRADVILDGGPLAMAWRDDRHVSMSGPCTTSFAGRLSPHLLVA